MNDSPQRVIVIGGGVIGTACAHYLQRSGWHVTIIDSGRFAGGCSHGNCGLVCPSHVLPLSEPGVVGKTIKALFSSNSPFSIKPRFSWALWSWLFQFARRCNTEDMLEAARARHALLQSSAALYRKLVAEEPLPCEWQTRGLLHVYASHLELEKYAQTDQMLREQFDTGATRYDARELLELEPSLKPGLAGGYHYEHDAHLRPDRLMASWRALLEGQGSVIAENCRFLRFLASGDQVQAAETSAGNMPANAFVVATGSWTPQLEKQLACTIPIQPGKGYSITMPRPADCPSTPLIFPEDKVAVTPMQSGYRLGSTMEFAGYDTSIHPQRLQLLKQGAAKYLKQPYCEPVEERWFGWRPMTFDGKPIIDRCPKFNNVFVAAGHNMLGLSMAPATGRLMSELVNRQTPHIDPQPYAIARFS